MTGSPADVLARLPEWADSDWSPLDGGLTNRTWKLEHGGRKAVLKIDSVPRSKPYNTRRQEARIQSTAAAAGLANDVLFADEELYLAGYAAGSVWSAASLADPGNLTRLAHALRRLHALPVCGRRFDAEGAADIYSRDIRHDRTLVSTCMKLIEECGSPRTLCLCHNDLVAGNIISAPEVRFLDWEYACDNDPLFDLATLVEHHGLDAATAMHLLDEYFEGEGDRRLDEFRLQRRRYRALLWLWLASRPVAQVGALRRAAEALTTSCS